MQNSSMNNSSNTTVNQIAKRDTIIAFSKKNKTCIEASGHWDTPEGVYCQIHKRNGKTYTKDVLLKNDEWDVFVLVKYQPAGQ